MTMMFDKQTIHIEDCLLVHLGKKSWKSPWKEIMAAHRCQQITNARQYERKYDGNTKGNMEVDGNLKRNIEVDATH